MINNAYASERTLSFSYYPDGNLFELKDHRHPHNGQQNEIMHIDRFQDYDNKVNTDGFMFLQDSHTAHMLLLPGVRLQKNNPLRHIRSGSGIHYEINYNYIYNDLKRPVQKTGDAVFTNGPDAGLHFQTNPSFTYY